jgi:hypothetical protein
MQVSAADATLDSGVFPSHGPQACLMPCDRREIEQNVTMRGPTPFLPNTFLHVIETTLHNAVAAVAARKSAQTDRMDEVKAARRVVWDPGANHSRGPDSPLGITWGSPTGLILPIQPPGIRFPELEYSKNMQSHP